LLHQQKTTGKMKATNIIIAAVLSLQAGILLHGLDDLSTVSKDAITGRNITYIAPVSPVEATFEDAGEINEIAFDFSSLVPVTPLEAGFNDVVPDVNSDLKVLAPVTPSEADFNDSTEGPESTLSYLAPVTPAEADFE
jgi:hypothetical protein